MVRILSVKESEILLLLVKDFFTDYNSNLVAKKLNISRPGAFKALKNLEKQGFVQGKRMGKATFYKVKLEDDYVFRTVETLLMNETREKSSRWLFEVEKFKPFTDAIILFGSILRTPEKARDIDVLFVFKEKNFDDVLNLVRDKNKILLNPLHPVMQKLSDLSKNLKEKQEVVEEILKTGHILHGYDKLLEVIKNVSSK